MLTVNEIWNAMRGLALHGMTFVLLSRRQMYIPVGVPSEAVAERGGGGEGRAEKEEFCLFAPLDRFLLAQARGRYGRRGQGSRAVGGGLTA